MVTRILFDPRRDLTDGTTTSQPVTIEATPTGIAENGAVAILPATLYFSITTGADIFQLPPSVASWCWRIVVKQNGVIKQQRTVQVPDVASVQYQKLVEVNPATLAVTTGTARQWDATYAQLLALINSGSTGTGLTDAGVANLIQAPASATALALSATYFPIPGGTKATGKAPVVQSDGSVQWGTVSGGGSTDYNALTNKPTLGTAAAQPATAFDPAGAATAAVAALVGAAATDLDTIYELAALLRSDDTALAALTTLVGQKLSAPTLGVDGNYHLTGA